MRLTDITIPMPDNFSSPKGKVMLIGHLLDGLVARPFTLIDRFEPETILGDNPMTRTARVLINAGVPKDNIVYYRLNGNSSRLIIENNEESIFEFYSIGANDADNDILVTVSQEGLVIKSIHDLEITPNRLVFNRSYLFKDYPYLSDLASAINEDASFGLTEIIAREIKNQETLSAFTIGEYRLSEGKSGESYIHEDVIPDDMKLIHESEYFELFSKYVLGNDYDGLSYQPLIEIPVEVMLYPDVYADDQKLVSMLAAGIGKQKTDEQQRQCYVLINSSPIPALKTLLEGEYMTSDSTYWDIILEEELPYDELVNQKVFALKLLNLFDEEELSLPLMENLMITIGEDARSSAPAAAFLASNILTSSSSDILSNKGFSGFSKLSHQLNKSMVASLSNSGYICIVPSIRKGYVSQIVQSMRLKTETLLSDWSNQRLLGEIKEDISLILDRYIGKPYGFFTVTGLENELKDYFDQQLNANHLQGYTLDPINQDVLNNEMSIALELSLPYEVRAISGTLDMKREGWEIDLWNLAQD